DAWCRRTLYARRHALCVADFPAQSRPRRSRDTRDCPRGRREYRHLQRHGCRAATALAIPESRTPDDALGEESRLQRLSGAEAARRATQLCGMETTGAI